MGGVGDRPPDSSVPGRGAVGLWRNGYGVRGNTSTDALMRSPSTSEGSVVGKRNCGNANSRGVDGGGLDDARWVGSGRKVRVAQRV